MSYDITTQIVFSVALLNVTVSLVCGLLLLWKRKEVPDRSRTILAIPLLLAVVVFANKMRLLAMHPDVNPIMEVLSPMIIFSAPIPQLLLLAYPVEVMRPRWMNWRRILLILVPWILLCVPKFFVEPTFFTPLYSAADLQTHLGEWNVWWRLMVMPLIIFYALLLTYLPYRWRESSASRCWIRAYVTVFILIGVFLLSWMITQHPVLQVLHTLCAMALTATFTWFELVERVYPSPVDEQSMAEEAFASPNSDDLWQRITSLLRDQQLFRNPDLGLDMLCEMVASNATYVSRSFKANADTTFSEYVNRLRVDYMAEQLLVRPDLPMKQLYFEAGFRTKSTALRNFQRYKGVSPSDFLAVRNPLTTN